MESVRKQNGMRLIAVADDSNFADFFASENPPVQIAALHKRHSKSVSSNIIRYIDHRGDGAVAASIDFRESPESLILNILDIMQEVVDQLVTTYGSLYISERVFIYVHSGLNLMGFHHEAEELSVDFYRCFKLVMDRFKSFIVSGLQWEQFISSCTHE